MAAKPGEGEGKGKGTAKGRGKSLMRREGRPRSVRWDVYLYYLRGLGLFGVVLCFLAVQVIPRCWPTTPSSTGARRRPPPGCPRHAAQHAHVNRYAGLQLGTVSAYCINYLLRILITQTGARFSHFHLAEIMLKAPVSFYDTSPLGRTLTLFSNDLRSMNVMLYAMLERTCLSPARCAPWWSSLRPLLAPSWSWQCRWWCWCMLSAALPRL